MCDTGDAGTGSVAGAASNVRSLRRRIRFWIAYSVYLLVLAAGGWAAFWWWIAGGAPFGGDQIELVWKITFPEIRASGIERAALGEADGAFDVLLLGGSVLDEAAPDVAQALGTVVDRPVRTFNLARAAHTSRDSALKFRKLRDRPVDLTVVYHGINDVRMNCCPAEWYRDDYRHCRRYEQFERRLKARRLILEEYWDETDAARMIPLGFPSAEFRKYGAEVKTERAFRANLREIVAGCLAEGRLVVLATFAWRLPEDYSRERFERGELDYGSGTYRFAVELWGDPENVASALRIHNRVIRELAAEFNGVIFVDLEKRMPREGRYFSDICHLTAEGKRLFAREIASAAAAHLRSAGSNGESKARGANSPRGSSHAEFR